MTRSTAPPKASFPNHTITSADRWLKHIRGLTRTAGARISARAPEYVPNVQYTHNGAPLTTSSDADYDWLFNPHLYGGPRLKKHHRRELVLLMADAYWRRHRFTKGSCAQAVDAFKKSGVVVAPWLGRVPGLYQGQVCSRADGPKRKQAGQRKGSATRKKTAAARLAKGDFSGLSTSHTATYKRNVRKIAARVARRLRVDMPSWREIRKDPVKWLDVDARKAERCASCRRRFGGRWRGKRRWVIIEHRKGGPHAGKLSAAACCVGCNQASRAAADASAATLHDAGETYGPDDACALARARLRFMGRGAPDAALDRFVADVRALALTVTNPAADTRLADARAPKRARRRRDTKRWDPVEAAAAPQSAPDPRTAKRAARRAAASG